MEQQTKLTGFETPAWMSYEAAKKLIDSGEGLSFYMRTKEQEDYNPYRLTFSNEQDRMAFILRDMAQLVTSPEVSCFISEIAGKMSRRNSRSNVYENLTREEFEYVIKFIENGKEAYRKSVYVNLEGLV